MTLTLAGSPQAPGLVWHSVPFGLLETDEVETNQQSGEPWCIPPPLSDVFPSSVGVRCIQERAGIDASIIIPPF